METIKNFIIKNYKTIISVLVGLFLLYWVIFILTPLNTMAITDSKKIDSLDNVVNEMYKEQDKLENKITDTMKKLFVLMSILSLSLTAFSQIDTNKEPVKCFPIPIVKQITKDLLSGDSAKAQLKLTEQQLYKTENIVEMKDSVISIMRVKEENYNTIILAQNEKYSILENHTKQLEWDLKKLKVKNKFTSILSGSAILILGTFLIIK
jgi:hypothetical protein